ncbi:hypothetical protein DNU06_06710 [Putridiphycobacter roseus]|uniref:Histidine phosphatase family protein n=1 Tax=Putridiphycobacter roseus TaxID=2219161 RepID=A0A2W1N149_9FLAO|nr:histidine phosphatase family protein [Putridiphycobacter roseus]PZE17514.1 hypothetical protein DNU06_06710 [Putridiphycobacter roseus]
MIKKFPIFILFLCGIVLISCKNSKQEKVIYLVRHAEKDLNDTSDNPPLTAAGVKRAQDLAKLLNEEDFKGIYSTKFQRNINTVLPLAILNELEIKTYEWHNWQSMLHEIMDQNKGTYIICGHGDNILPMIEDLGIKKQLPPLGKLEYNKLYKVTMSKDSTTIEIIQF